MVKTLPIKPTEITKTYIFEMESDYIFTDGSRENPHEFRLDITTKTETKDMTMFRIYSFGPSSNGSFNQGDERRLTCFYIPDTDTFQLTHQNPDYSEWLFERMHEGSETYIILTHKGIRITLE